MTAATATNFELIEVLKQNHFTVEKKNVQTHSGSVQQ